MSNDKEQVMSDYIKKLEKENLKLAIENANLKDELINAGEYAETDGYEVGSASDYKDDKQLSLDFEIEKTSDNDFEVIYGHHGYGRRAEDKVREQFNRECD